MELRKIEDGKLEILDYIKLTWYFDKWYEKLILVLLSFFGVWKIIGLII